MSKLSLTKNYTAYSDYKSVVLEEGEKIPLHWNVDKISNIGFIPKERSPYGELLSVYLDRGVIRASDGSLGTHAVSEDLSKYQVVKKGDLILNNQQAWRGSVGVSELEGIISPAYILFRFQKNIFPRYYNYLCRSPLVVDQFRLHSKGVGNIQRQIQGNALKNVKVIIPPKEEQEKIARFLDEQTARIDETIAKKERLIELLKEKRTATINHAVTKGLDPKAELVDSGIDWIGKIPKGWNLEKLKYVAPLVTLKTSLESASSNYIALENAEGKTGRYIPSTEAVNPDSIVSVFDGTDVLFSKLRPYLAKVLVPGFKGFATGEFLVLRPRKKITKGYLKYRLLSQDFITIVNDSTYGAQMPRANWNFIGSQVLTLPTLEEQKKIFQYLDNLVEKYQFVIEESQKTISLLQELKSSLISHAVTGKIKV